MNRSNPAATLLFWTMMLVGGASLAASLWLPAWLEMRQAQANERARIRIRDELQETLTALDRRREHLERDPSYIARIARREFSDDPAERENAAIDVFAAPPPSSAPAAPADPEWMTTLEHLAQTHPLVRMYIEPGVRWKIQILSAALVLAAILFLARRPEAAAAPDGAGRAAAGSRPEIDEPAGADENQPAQVH